MDYDVAAKYWIEKDRKSVAMEPGSKGEKRYGYSV